MNKDEYIVVSDEDFRNFQTSVIGKIHDGYKVAGGVCVTRTSGSSGITATFGKTTYYQAMVLKPIENGK